MILKGKQPYHRRGKITSANYHTNYVARKLTHARTLLNCMPEVPGSDLDREKLTWSCSRFSQSLGPSTQRPWHSLLSITHYDPIRVVKAKKYTETVFQSLQKMLMLCMKLRIGWCAYTTVYYKQPRYWKQDLIRKTSCQICATAFCTDSTLNAM